MDSSQKNTPRRLHLQAGNTAAATAAAAQPGQQVSGAGTGAQGAKPQAAKPAAATQNPAQPARRPAAPAPPVVTIRPAAGAARARRRHWGILLSFVLVVLLPMMLAGGYLYTRAVDQYASTVGFSVRKEDFNSPVDMLGGIAKLSGSSSSDTDILYKFIQSQELVADIDSRIDLRRLYSKPQNDPVFAFDPAGSIEDLVDYWQRMVKVNYDVGTGLIELRVTAFSPEDAQQIATAIFDKSSVMINELSAIAREDATRYAREELARTKDELKKAREELTQFRSRTQIVDPTADIQGQMGLLTTLQQQLAEALIEADLLRETTREGDPRLAQLKRRISVIRGQIDEERRKFGVGSEETGGEDYATLIAEFERLSADREFAEQAYVAARVSLEAALADARRKSRYLAAYIRPTLAETPQYPKRGMLLGLTGLFLLSFWVIGLLIYYSVRDRR